MRKFTKDCDLKSVAIICNIVMAIGVVVAFLCVKRKEKLNDMYIQDNEDSIFLDACGDNYVTLYERYKNDSDEDIYL